MNNQEKKPAPQLPDIIMEEATYTFGESGRTPIIMKADTIVIYNAEQDKTELKGISFFQMKEENGETFVEMSGSCDNAVVTNNNSYAQLSGNVILTKKTDNFTIKCDNLIWDDDNQTIASTGIADVVYEDGTVIKATGFKAELNNNVYSFENILEGRYSNEN